MIKIPTVSLLVVFLAAVVAAQGPAAPDLSSDPRVRWLEKEAVKIRTVDPADEDFRDLQPLKKAIGDAQIVMLGEITHLDGTTFLAKSRLIKFLHQQMNFDVLVFESGFYDMSKAWESIREGEDPVATVQRSMMGVWKRSPQVANLLAYIGASARSPRPLALAGFDLQHHAISTGSLLSELDALAARLGIASDVTTQGSPARAIAVNLLADKYYGAQAIPVPDVAARKAFSDGLDVLRERLASAATASTEAEAEFWRQVVLSSLKSFAEMVWAYRDLGAKDPTWTQFNLRDRQNADNLLWLADHQYRGKKLIVWGATVHLMRQASAIDPNINPKNPQRPYTTMVPLGEQVWRRVGPRAYVIGFTNYEGVMGIGDPVNDKENSVRAEVEKDQDPSIELEELLNAARFDYALVDFRKPARGGEWLKAPIVSRPLASQGMRAVWPNVLDAMFFIRVMEPNLATFPR